jgi:hydrogenase maturation protein HypF
MISVRKSLKEGRIVAIKGLGGYHLACDAKNPEAVSELRRRKIRDGKPFALMAKDLDTIQDYCYIGHKEKSLLESWKRPIVLLTRKESIDIPLDVISSDNQLLGVMLPYTPLHHMLFEDGLDILVMTSEPDFAGEKLYRPALDKAISLAGRLPENIELYADGGLTPEALKELKISGAAGAVLGRLVFTAENPYQKLVDLSFI